MWPGGSWDSWAPTPRDTSEVCVPSEDTQFILGQSLRGEDLKPKVRACSLIPTALLFQQVERLLPLCEASKSTGWAAVALILGTILPWASDPATVQWAAIDSVTLFPRASDPTAVQWTVRDPVTPVLWASDPTAVQWAVSDVELVAFPTQHLLSGPSPGTQILSGNSSHLLPLQTFADG